MIPRITNAAQVKEVVGMMKYPPVGYRGNAQGRGYTNFLSGNVMETMKKANAESLLVIQIETKEAVEDIDAILSIPEVDILLVGPNDLSISLGVGGQNDSPVLSAAIEKVIESCNKHNKVPGIHCNDLASAVHWSKKGMRFVSGLSDVGLIMKAGKEVTSSLNNSFQKK
eukprot:TRINITY_DN1701_c0_g1_i1.p1 TRINITY_DN1701_c0_g1~~TRINITY_DN1701_c0_g1_i1.p1  ORF type:complete len:169 (-),score=48.56 TRINITY_DN1701_c0_g1_i1:83-589(-)